MPDTITTAALLAVLSAAAPGGDDWHAACASEARRLTKALGMAWDFTSWPDALRSARRGRLAGFDLTGHDPVESEVATVDRATVHARTHGTELLRLYQESSAAWDNCVETAGISPDTDERLVKRERAAEGARNDALGHWIIALASLADGRPLSVVREALEAARDLAAEWGDDTPERKALALLEDREILSVAAIDVAGLPPDLLREALNATCEVQAYAVTIDGQAQAAMVLVALGAESGPRAGVAWGADAAWTDVCAEEPEAAAREAVERYLRGEMVQ